MNNHSKSIFLNSIENIRDLSSMINLDGFHIKKNKILRSACLDKANNDDLNFLYNYYDLRTVIDLRSPNEKYERPDKLIKGIEPVSILLQQGSVVGVNQDEETRRKEKLYFEELDKKCQNEDFAKQHMCEFYYSVGCDEYALNGFKKIFKVLLENDNGTLIHCSLGRDRAGMAIALIQRVLSFDIDSIIDDYLYTNECRNIINPISYNYSHALKEYIISFFDGIDNKYGCFNHFINELGLDTIKIEELRFKYLERS